jgi:ferredoxin
MSNLCKIVFPGTNFAPIILESEQNLSEHLTIQNSPVLFGCRTGICGTCLVEVSGDLSLPESNEQELLAILAPNNPRARLACQIKISSDLEITSLPSQ